MSGQEPDFIGKFDVASVDLEVNKQLSAIYRGVIGLIVLRGALDFKTGQPPQYEKERVQDDHIFPKSIFKYDGIANRTLISTNIQKGNKKPSQYFAQILTEHGESKAEEILESHLIPRAALNDLLKDNITTFIEKRKTAIMEEVKRRTS